MSDDYEFRIAVFGEPRSPWRDTAAEAKADAIDLGLASYDEEAREHYLAVPVSLQRRKREPSATS